MTFELTFNLGTILADNLHFFPIFHAGISDTTYYYFMLSVTDVNTFCTVHFILFTDLPPCKS